MKTRIFQTRFYDDEDTVEMNLFEQHLYLYLLTCQYINISGMFQLSPKKIQFEAKLTEEQFSEASEKIERLKKAIFYKGWVYVVNARKNNNYEKSEDNQKACNNELERVPSDVKEYFNTVVCTVLSTVVWTVPIIHKQEIIKKRVVKGETKKEQSPQLENVEKMLVEKFNLVCDGRYKGFPKEVENGLAYWLTIYTMEDMFQAIDNIKYDDFWKDKMTLVMLFRRSNPKGEAIDYIGSLLKVRAPLTWEERVEEIATSLGGKDAYVK